MYQVLLKRCWCILNHFCSVKVLGILVCWPIVDTQTQSETLLQKHELKLENPIYWSSLKVASNQLQLCEKDILDN